MIAIIGSLALPLGSYVFLYKIRIGLFAKILAAIVAAILLGMIVPAENPFLLTVKLLIIFSVPLGLAAFLVYKFLISGEGGTEDKVYSVKFLVSIVLAFCSVLIPLAIYLFGLSWNVIIFLGVAIAITIAVEYFLKPIRIAILYLKYRYKLSKAKDGYPRKE